MNRRPVMVGVAAELRAALAAAQAESFGVNYQRTYQSAEDDYNEVYPGIWVSSYYFAKSIPTLTKVGITHVLNCAEGITHISVVTGTSFYESTGIVYKGIRAQDHLNYDLSKHFDDCGEFIADALKKDGKVLIHCYQGISRSATIAAAYLVKYLGLSAEEALVIIGSKRREIDPNINFLNLLSRYDSQLHSGSKK